MFLVNSRLGLVSATLDAFEVNSNTSRVLLIPKLRRYFAEFLHHDSLDRLGILYLSTCVGLGYGRLISRSRRFSRQHRITLTSTKVNDTSCLRHMKRGFAYVSPYTLEPVNPRPTRATFLRPSAACLIRTWVADSVKFRPKTSLHLACLALFGSAGAIFRRYGNITPLSIDYACRPRLRSRLTQGRLA